MFEETSPELFREVLERLLVGIYVVDSTRRITFWNDGAERISGYQRHEVLGRFCRDNLLEHCDNESRILCHSECPLTGAMQDGHPRELRMYLKHRDGSRLPVIVRCVAIRDASGGIVGAAESFDVRRLAPTAGNRPGSASDQTDELTGLPDASFLLSYLQQRIASTGEEFRPFTLLRLEVSLYHELVRRYGATACSGLLRNVSHSLRDALKPSDVLARWGNSQFLVALEVHEETLLRKVRERLQSAVDSTRLDWWGDSIAVKVIIDQRTVERREEKQSVLSWLGSVPSTQPLRMGVEVHTMRCAAEIEE